MRIDSHQHFWRYDPVKGAWITDDMKAIRRDFLPDDLSPLFQAHGIDGCVAVQADQTEDENHFLLDLAQSNSWIKGVVGWLDLKADNLEERIQFFSENERFKGVRHVLQTEPDGFMSDPDFVSGVTKVGENQLTYDILTIENQLNEVVEFVSALPEMPLVIDHISKPNISTSSFDHWSKCMKELSEFDHVHVKLSGMITEANWETWSIQDLKPYVDFCLEHFGPDRLMYGSDWPVCLVAGKYDQVIFSIKALIAQLSSDEQAAIFGLTASRFYNLG